MYNYLIIGIISVSILIVVLLVILIMKTKKIKKQPAPVINFTKVESISELKDVENSTNDLEQLLKRMEEDLEKQSTIDPISAYEQEQEDKAIISYQELLAIKDQDNKKTIPEIEELIDTEKKFKNTDFISPVYGKQEINMSYPKVETFERNKSIDFNRYQEKKQPTFDLEKTLNLTPITEEIKNSEEFLTALKDFRNNL